MSDQDLQDDSNRPILSNQPQSHGSMRSVFVSTFTSLGIVLVLLLLLRWVLPPLLESSRYSWYRGQLRAEHEAAGEQLRNVSLDGLSRVSELVSQRVTPSVVHINVKQTSDENALVQYKSDGQGSGVIVDRDGYILTNNHVLEGGVLINVRFSDDSHREARIVGIDEARDLAVLQVNELDLPSVEWGNSDTTTVGAPVWAVGSPFGLHGSITFGIISSKHRGDLSESSYQYTNRIQSQYSDLIQSDVAVNPGNSGGPLVNGQGQLIGINTAILGEWYRGVSFSIPSNLVKEIYEEILEKSKDAPGWLGVRLETISASKRKFPSRDIDKRKSEDGNSDIASELDSNVDVDEIISEAISPEPLKGVRIVEYVGLDYSPARQGGLKIDDVIVSFNGQAIDDQMQLIAAIGKTKSKSKAKFEVIRQGARKVIEIELGARPIKLASPPKPE
jgi:serine protease Do